MKNGKIIYRNLFGLLIAGVLSLFVPHIVFCQTETLDIVQYTPPKGWTKTPKEGAVVFSDINKTGGFCILSVYPSTSSVGSPQKDFAKDWNELAVKPFKAEANPKTEAQPDDGWTSVSGASQIEMDGIKTFVLLTVLTGYGKTASVFTILNDQSYLPQLDAFMASIKMVKTKATASLQTDPANQTPSANGSATNSTILGKWAKSTSGTNGVDSSENILNSSYYKMQYTFNPDGSYSLKAEKWMGYIRSNEYWMTDETGSYAVAGDQLTIMPKKSTTTVRNREGAIVKSQNNALERTTYAWTIHYFSGIDETDLILHTEQETQRDGMFGSSDLFPRSYLFSRKYNPEWKFD